jgi:N-acetylglutamate synthase-like GNAT family acetyltransferase
MQQLASCCAFAIRSHERMQHYSIRRATSADVGTIIEITRAAYTKWIPVIGREPKPMTADYHQAVAHHVIDLCEEDGQPIALIELIPKPLHLLIENVAVLPDWHGSGIGGILLERAEAIARCLGLDQLRLYTNAMFSTNIAFYAHRGFEEFLREQHPARGEVVHMRKSVPLALTS